MFIQSTRGTFGSGGQFRPFLPERDDGLATVSWLRDQPRCDGQVSMTGASYSGHTQWAVAPYVDPPLRSVSLNITTAKFTTAFYEHGVPSLANALNWTGLVGRQERGLLAVIPNPRQQARMKRAPRKVPLQAADVDVAGAPVAFWRDFVGHAAPEDEFWACVDHDRADLTRVHAGHRIRVQVSGGAFPRFARNFGTAQPFGAATRALRCRFEVYHDSRHPARILLPVLPLA